MFSISFLLKVLRNSWKKKWKKILKTYLPWLLGSSERNENGTKHTINYWPSSVDFWRFWVDHLYSKVVVEERKEGWWGQKLRSPQKMILRTRILCRMINKQNEESCFWTTGEKLKILSKLWRKMATNENTCEFCSVGLYSVGATREKFFCWKEMRKWVWRVWKLNKKNSKKILKFKTKRVFCLEWA